LGRGLHAPAGELALLQHHRDRQMRAVAVAFAISASTASVVFPRAAGAATVDTSPVTVYHAPRKQLALRMLREEGLKIREADGGKLTDAHRAYLDAKLKAIAMGNY
jgi:hypothetical protein